MDENPILEISIDLAAPKKPILCKWRAPIGGNANPPNPRYPISKKSGVTPSPT